MNHLLKNIRVGALHGLAAWLAYGILEYWLTCWLPLARDTGTVFSPWAWHLTFLLFGMYAAFGLVLGAAAGAVLGRRGAVESERLRAAASLTVVLGLLVNLATVRPRAASGYVALGVAAVLAAILMLQLRADSGAKRMDWSNSPWLASAIILAVPWTSRNFFHSGLLAAVTWAGIVLATITVAAAAAAWVGTGRTLSRQLLTATLACTAVLGSAYLLGSREEPEAGAAVKAARGRYNLLLITMDTVRADHLSLYGYARDTTPHLKQLAKHATVYTRAIAAADMTLSSHASLFTGVYPSWHGAHTLLPQYPEGRPLDGKLQTLAGILSANGYATAAVAANYAYLQKSFGLSRGFAAYDVRTPVVMSNPGRAFYIREGLRRFLRSLGLAADFEVRHRRAEEITSEAFRLLGRERRAGGAFFLFLNYMDAHMPYVPPEPYRSLYPGRQPQFTAEDYLTVNREVVRQNRRLSEAERQHFVSQYDGGIAYIDSQIGRLLERLRQLGLYDNTLIVITADHGEALGEKNMVGHGVLSLYEDEIHVPLIIKYPGERAGREVPTTVSQVDVMPTVLGVLGCAAPGGIQGSNLLDAAGGGPAYVVSEAYPEGLLAGSHPRFRGSKRALVAGSKKLITWTEGAPELYDLDQDPDERRNLARSEPEQAAALNAELAAWAGNAPRPGTSVRAMDAKTLERLKSLGYVQ